jgi:hypothetical protein
MGAVLQKGSALLQVVFWAIAPEPMVKSSARNARVLPVKTRVKQYIYIDNF